MKKIINFERKLEFPSMIGEITSISLDQDLKFKDESNICGKLVVKGTYKRTEATRLEEDFSFDLPTEILLNEKIDLNTGKIEIDDFYYELENDDTVICHIDILVEGVEIVEIPDAEEEPAIELEHHDIKIDKIEKSLSEDLRECDGDYPAATAEIVKEEEKKMPKEEMENESVGSLFTALKDSEETFSTYSVYIVKEETIEMILNKFKITKEELEAYNDISNIGKGSKLIIPLNNETS